MHAHLKLSPQVELALKTRKGVVALESTLLAHGMPAHRRLDVAARMNQEVESQGAVPAVIAVLDGVIHVGLSHVELERLCTATTVHKCSERELAVALATGGIHATTVSSTMWAARQAGIHVFATGGIGGVHRGAETTFDESQDLHALGQHPVAVISAGAKAILDLPRTLERLETLGVLVVGYQCKNLPAFYVRDSGLPLDVSTDSMTTLARMCHARFGLLKQGGMLVCNPVPAENALDETLMNASLDDALAQAAAKGIQGKALTPFLLAAMERITHGKSVETNLALACHNAKVGAQLAVELAGLTS